MVLLRDLTPGTQIKVTLHGRQKNAFEQVPVEIWTIVETMDSVIWYTVNGKKTYKGTESFVAMQSYNSMQVIFQP